jgi:DNA polymerase-3 subunit alpha
MVGEFTHLHLHTQYSLLDGAIRLKDLFPKVLELGMKQVAVTDHGNLYGAIDVYLQAKAHGVKPIFGCETYVSSGVDRKDRSSRKNFHLILLAKNQVGWKNLQYLNSMGFIEGFYYNPRIDKPLLKAHSEGLIGLSACLGSEVAQTVTKQGIEKAKEVALEYRSLFEEGSYYLEVMPNGLTEQEEVNQAYRKMGHELGIPVVATNDCHYVNRSDYKAHEVLMAIQQKRTIYDRDRLSHDVDAYYIKSTAEMEAAFRDWPEVLENAAKIASECNVEFKLGKPMLPLYGVPDGYDLDSYVVKVAHDGLERRFGEKRARGEAFDADEYQTRLDFELGVIRKMGFSGYFLIVWDFINWAKNQSIPVGPGRGSGAGSLAAYALRITDIDPLPFKLLFERFLNPERVSMPDFDIDFCMNRRDEVIGYVGEKYGKDRVGQIATFHQLKSRGCVRDVARALAIPLGEADKIAKLVPEPKQGKPPPIDKAIAEEPRLKELYDTDPKVHELLDFAKGLEGLNRHAGMHAAGIVISEGPLWEYVPVFTDDNGGLVTQYAKDEVEKAGLVKFDFLGLKTLTVIETAVKLVNEQRAAADGGPPLDMSLVPLDDAEVYKMIAAGDTTGVFQLESSGFREILKKLKPDNIEDIVAAVALYRPGPLEGGMVDDFIDRKHGRKRVVYPHPSLEIVLKDTYGVIVYQEQVMQIAQVLAGYTLGGADLLRRAMGKKKLEEMAKEKAKFVEGADRQGVDKKLAEEIFDLVEKFAGYGFNRSHSAAYGLVTYHTGYLKRHFPHEFMAGLLTCDKDNTDNIVKFIAEARAMGLRIERPDVNESVSDFSVVWMNVPAAEPASGQNGPNSKNGKAKANGASGSAGANGGSGAAPITRVKVVRFGLGAVRGVGEGAVEAILAARKEGGAFKSIYDFCERVDTTKVNRRVVEALIKAGAFDGVAAAGKGPNGKPLSRAQLFEGTERALERAAQAQKDRKSGQTSLFGLLGGAPAAPKGQAAAGGPAASGDEKYADLEEWAPKLFLANEKEALGFYITGHPLDRFQADMSRYASVNTSGLELYAGKDSQVTIGGIVTDYQDKPTKSGNGRVAFFKLEDQYGQVKAVVFPKAYEKLQPVLGGDEPLLVTGKVVDEGEGESSDYKIFVDDAVPLAKLRSERTKSVHLYLNADAVTKAQIVELAGLLGQHRGSCSTWLHLRIPMRSETVVPLGDRYACAPSDELLTRIERLFGERVAMLR